MVFATFGSRNQVLWLAVGLVWMWAAVLSLTGPSLGDEWVHWEQIQRLIEGDHAVPDDLLTTLPGYHYLVAGLLWAASIESFALARLLNAGFGIVAVGMFYLVRKQRGGGNAAIATAQFAVLPIVMPYHFLVYTDSLSLALVLAAVWAGGAARMGLAAVLILCAIAVRQNNVIWLGLVAMLWHWRTDDSREWWAVERLRDSANQLWPLVIPGLFFVAYWIVAGRISYSGVQSAMHPDVRFGTGNLLFALFAIACLLPLQVAHGASALIRGDSRRPVLAAVLVAGGAIVVATFEADHPYNRVALGYNLRNTLLLGVEQSAWLRLGLTAMVAASACFLATCWRDARTGRALLGSCVLFLSASWLIETRYLFIPLALLLAFRQQSSSKVEYLTLALWLIFAVSVPYAYFDLRFSL